jgi:ribosomal protein L40E
MTPSPLPFWEQQRGHGPLTAWQKSREALAEQAAKRAERIRDPLTHVKDNFSACQSGRDGLTRVQRRQRGLCFRCGARAVDGLRQCRRHNDDDMRRKRARYRGEEQ